MMTIVKMIRERLSDGNLDGVIAFFREANPFAQKTWGWDTGRFLDWRWGANTLREEAHPGWFGANCAVFRQGSRIRAVAVAEYGEEEVTVITPGEDRDAVDQVVDWVFERSGEHTFVVSSDSTWLSEILAERSLVEEANVGCEWEYHLETAQEPSFLPQGFSLGSLADPRVDDHQRIADCIRRAFGSEYDHLPVLFSIEASPWFRPELSLLARTHDGRIAAYCRGTVDPQNGVCGIDPVCTDPDFQRMGLGKAVVQACFRAQLGFGGRHTYIGSAPEPAPGTSLYRSLGPSAQTIMSAWRRPPEPAGTQS
jgi:GNAT superfamily N-acetyltransferase